MPRRLGEKGVETWNDATPVGLPDHIELSQTTVYDTCRATALRSKQYVAPVGSASAGVGSSRSRQRSRKCSCAADRSFSVASRHLAIKACGVTRKCSCGKAAASGGCCEDYNSMSRLGILFWIRLSMRPSTRSGRSPSFRFCSASGWIWIDEQESYCRANVP